MTAASPSLPASTYRPLLALPWWDTIGPFLTPLVDDAAQQLGVPARALYPVVTPFVLWCWQRNGIALNAAAMFQRRRIDLFVTVGMPEASRGTRNTFRGRLLRVSETLGTADSTPLNRIGRSTPTAPYTSPQLAELYSWAQTRSTATAKRDAGTLLALGLGAGLPTRELLSIKRRHVADDAATIRVPGAAARTVTVEPEWRPVLQRALPDLPADGWLFRRNRTGASSGQVTDFVRRSGTTLDIRPARMRSTWLLRRLTRNDPVDTLLTESGLRTYAALDRYRPHTQTRT